MERMKVAMVLMVLGVAGVLVVGGSDAWALQVSYTAEADTTVATDRALDDGAQDGVFDANTGVNYGWRPYWFGMYSYDMNVTPPDGITIPGSTNLGTAFTIGAWYVRTSDMGEQSLFSNYNGGGVGAGHLIFDLDPGAVSAGSHAMRFFVNGVLVGTGDGVSLFNGYGPPLDGWHHHVATYNNGAVNLYLDGVLVASGTAGSGAVVLANDLVVGRDLGGGQPQLSGFVDDILILDRALSAVEIDSLYHNGNDAFLLVQFETVHGTVVLGDYAGNPAIPVAVAVELRQNQALVQTVPQILDANSQFTIENVPHGTYDVVVKAYAHLQKVATNVTIDSNNTDLGTIELIAGDTDGDNEVTTSDLATVLLNMDLVGD